MKASLIIINNNFLFFGIIWPFIYFLNLFYLVTVLMRFEPHYQTSFNTLTLGDQPVVPLKLDCKQ